MVFYCSMWSDTAWNMYVPNHSTSHMHERHCLLSAIRHLLHSHIRYGQVHMLIDLVEQAPDQSVISELHQHLKTFESLHKANKTARRTILAHVNDSCKLCWASQPDVSRHMLRFDHYVVDQFGRPA